MRLVISTIGHKPAHPSDHGLSRRGRRREKKGQENKKR